MMGQVVQLLHETRRAAGAGLGLLAAAESKVGHDVGQALEQFTRGALLTTGRRLTGRVSSTISPLVRVASLPRLRRRHLETPSWTVITHTGVDGILQNLSNPPVPYPWSGRHQNGTDRSPDEWAEHSVEKLSN